jgi:CxxC-x17-CxxC domain-containing protein
MENFRKGGKGGFFRPGGFNKGKDRGNRENRGPVTMHSAICSSCGKTCEVPFRPTGDKPVYCRDCFAGRAALGGERSHRKDIRDGGRDGRDFRGGVQVGAPAPVQARPDNGEMKKQIQELTLKVDKLVYQVQTLVKVMTKTPEVVASVPEEVKVVKKVKKVIKK